MRVKQLWAWVPLPQTLRLVWDRVTFSRLTTIYFVVALVHCFVQVIFQISALFINTDASRILSHIASTNPNATAGFAVLTKNGPLRACTGMPGSTGSTPCQMIWTGKVSPDAFGDYPDYSYANTSTTASATLSSSASLVSSSVSLVTSTVQSSAAARTTTVSVAASAKVTPSAATAVAIQTTSTTPGSTLSVLSASSLSSTSTKTPLSVTTTVIAPIVATSSSLASTSAAPLAPGGSPITPVGPARAKRMYIPSRIPGSKHFLSRRDITLTPVFSEFNGTFEGVKLQGLTAAQHDGTGDHETDEAFVSSVCVQVLQWPLQKLWNTQREDIVFIGFQFWVLGMSIVALLNESVPHIIAAFLTHIMVTSWSVFQIIHTANFRSEFNRLTTHGACGGVNLLPTYWKLRANAEIPVLVLNVVVLIASAYMSWRLLKTFGWLTFKRVGASLEINRIYTLVLSLGIVLQLGLFFLVVSIALWLEELYRGPAAGETSMGGFYKAILIIQLIALGPWFVMGWYAVRREMRKTMITFLVLSALFIVAWAAMFVCPTWRLTYLTWMFFRIMSTNAVVLTVLAFGLGIVCWLNFGKDLSKHLQLNDDPEGSDFVPAQPSYDPEKGEKVEFPTQNMVPTFSAAFPSRPSSAASSSTHSRSDSNVVPPPVVGRPPVYQNFEVERPVSSAVGSGNRASGLSCADSMASSRSAASVHDPFEQDLARMMSTNTYPTMRSVASDRSVDTATVGMGKRWVIE